MADYRKMYYILFNAMSESCEMMLNAIHDAEALYMKDDNVVLKLSPPVETDE